VCLYGIALSAEEGPADRLPEPAAAGEIEKITQAFYEALKISGYVKPGNDAVYEKKVRRLMLRLNLDTMDAKVFLGMVRQLVWKLRQTNDR
jgi:tRNA C32,U32 (ribose-2'-O)-methylase TrmJ